MPTNEYQRRDAMLIDYQLYELPGIKPYPHDGVFRGPAVRGSRYIACVGAAQTFGRFVESPFPTILGHRLGIEVLNLGSGGAGPAFHGSNDALLSYINRAAIVVVQVMSARSASNSLFHNKYHGAWGIRLTDGLQMSAADFFSDLLQTQPDQARSVVRETRSNYVRDMVRLLSAISPPKILLWFATRAPNYVERYQLPLDHLFGAFPQLVNGVMIDQIIPYSDAYVECVTNAGLPQQLFDKTGRATRVLTTVSPGVTVEITESSYYPSPEMHRAAADTLESICVRLLRDRRTADELHGKDAPATPALEALPAPKPGTERTDWWGV